MKKIICLISLFCLFASGYAQNRTTQRRPQATKSAAKPKSNQPRSSASTSSQDIIKKIQGHWAINSAFGRADIYISGNNLRFDANGSKLYDGPYKYMSAAESGLGYACLRYNKHDNVMVSEKGVLMFTQTEPMVQVVTGNETINTATPTDKEKEAAALLKLMQLGNEGKNLVTELRKLRNNGQLSSSRAFTIKNRLIAIKDEQIQISRSLNDSKLISEYTQQKQQLLRSLAAMGL